MTKPQQASGRVPEIDHLYAQQFEKLVRYAEYLLGQNRQSAEDVVQEAFARLIRHPLNDFSHGAAWLKTVVTRLSYDRMRELKRRGYEDVPEGRYPSAEDVSLQEFDRKLLRTALETLPERDSQALWMRHNGYRYKEIAHKLGIDPTQVGMVLVRAMKKLRVAYHTEQEDPDEQLSPRPRVARVPRPGNN